MPFKREAGKIFWTSGLDVYEVAPGTHFPGVGFRAASWPDRLSFERELAALLPEPAGAEQTDDADHDEDHPQERPATDHGGERQDPEDDQQHSD